MLMDAQLQKLLTASIALQAQLVANQEGATKPEIVLAWAGLSHKEIATILGKPITAISKAISRAKSARKESNEE